MKGPSTVDLVGHHLTEAIKHLSAAAELTRELTREDANELAMSLTRTLEAVRDARGDVEGTTSTDLRFCKYSVPFGPGTQKCACHGVATAAPIRR